MGKVPITMAKGGTYSYESVSNSDRAYDNNLILESGHYVIYTGYVNGDHVVNMSVLLAIYNNPYGTGCYLRENLTGNGSVDLEDIMLAFANSKTFTETHSPCSRVTLIVRQCDKKMIVLIIWIFYIYVLDFI